MKTFRPQDYVVAVLFVAAMIGPALLGLCCHLVGVAIKSTWEAVTHG
jgi:hypothetical protein